VRFVIAIALTGVLFAAACRSTGGGYGPGGNSPGGPASSSPMARPSAVTVKSKVDVCGLLTSDDLKAVQGEAYKEAQRSDREDRGLVISQCYYQMPTMANSVVLSVTTPKRGGGSRIPGVFWEETFHKDGEKERDRKRDRDRTKEKAPERGEAEEEGPPPERIKGLGQEAFWSASRVGGALYVKRNDNILFRISVGGADNASSKLNKSKKLAQLILKKLGPLLREG